MSFFFSHSSMVACLISDKGSSYCGDWCDFNWTMYQVAFEYGVCLATTTQIDTMLMRLGKNDKKQDER